MDERKARVAPIAAAVPVVELMTEENNKITQESGIGYFVVQLTKKRFDLVMRAAAEVDYDYNDPWEFWYYIGKIISKAFFDDPDRLKWFGATPVSTREFLAFADKHRPRPPLSEQDLFRVVEVDFLKPQPGERIKLFWKPARDIIRQNVKHWVESNMNGVNDSRNLE